MSDALLNAWSFGATESNLVRSVDSDFVINRFASSKACKAKLSTQFTCLLTLLIAQVAAALLVHVLLRVP